MKNIKSYVYIACLTFFIAGCTDQFVDLEPDHLLAPENIYSSLEGIETSIPGIFYQARDYATWEDGCGYKYGPTDLERSGTNIRDDQDYNAAYLFVSFDAENDFIKELWESLYLGLHKCNVALETLDELDINENDLEIKGRRDAVAGILYFFRAYFHLELVHRWDNIVLADHVFADPSEVITLASKTDVYDLIVSDLQTAIPLLPEATSIMTDRGHITKGVARMVLALAYMDIEAYAGAAAMASAVVEDDAYNLVGIDEVFSVAHQDNNEIILSWQFVQGEGSADFGQRLSNRFLPLYDRVNGVTRDFQYGGRPYSRYSVSEYYWTLFEEDDLRLDGWHTRFYIYDGRTEDPPAGVVVGDTVTAENYESTRADLGVRVFEPTTAKHHEDSTFGRQIGMAEGWRNVIQYRLAEAYIVGAEAYLQSGNMDSALYMINPIRERAGVDPFTTLTMDNILDEHARELGHEYSRFPMLKRLGILVERVQAYNEDVGPVFRDVNVRWPIPYGFQKLTGVPQNPGYN
jgi:hypothetical protein